MPIIFVFLFLFKDIFQVHSLEEEQEEEDLYGDIDE